MTIAIPARDGEPPEDEADGRARVEQSVDQRELGDAQRINPSTKSTTNSNGR